MKEIKGITGAAGRARGRAMVLILDHQEVQKYSISDSAGEIDKLNRARELYTIELSELYDTVKNEIGEEAAAIFQAYKEIVKDDYFFGEVCRRIAEERVNAAAILQEEQEKVSQMFETLEDAYMRERGADMENVCRELTSYILGRKQEQEEIITEDVIVVAEDLTPADTVRLDKERVKAFVTEKGGRTSHTVILAKTLGIPAVIGAAGLLKEVSAGDMIYVDAELGCVRINPEETYQREFEAALELEHSEGKKYEREAGQPAVTKDGYEIEVCMNSGDSESLSQLEAKSCDGIGLLRTEFLYMAAKTYPTEEEQARAYIQAVKKAEGKPVIIRTLDIGGDKQLDYMNLPKEENPFLGYRAIRICLDQKEMFRTQLRAVLRASAYGNAKIMFPMIDTLGELREAKQEVEQAKKELSEAGIKYNTEIPIGIMVETPAAIFISDKLAKEAEFFSIGSNDLIQYITATDRMNEKVQYLYSNYNVSVLRAIKIAAENAHRAGIQIGICGEIASDELLTPFFVGIGIEELSMVPGQINHIRYQIRRIEKRNAEHLVRQVLEADTEKEVYELLQSYHKKMEEKEEL